MYTKPKIDRKYFAKALINANGFCLYKDVPFVSVSGLKEPFFQDHRLLYSIPEVRSAIANGMVRLILENYQLPDAIVGVAIGALPLATLVADKLDLPLAYVRPAIKDHGRRKLVEGVVPEGSKAVIVEDVIIKGTSAINTYRAITAQKASVLGIVSIYNQKMDAMVKNLSEVNLKNHSLYDIDVLLEVSQEVGYLTQERYDEIIAWRKDPDNYFTNKSKV